MMATLAVIKIMRDIKNVHVSSLLSVKTIKIEKNRNPVDDSSELLTKRSVWSSAKRTVLLYPVHVTETSLTVNESAIYTLNINPTPLGCPRFGLVTD
jgi:hypothetical protein